MVTVQQTINICQVGKPRRVLFICYIKDYIHNKMSQMYIEMKVHKSIKMFKVFVDCC
jgi:hypothetical protein